MRRCVGIAAALLALCFVVPLHAQKEAKGGVETKIALETSMENRLKQVLTEITGTEKMVVIVNVQLATEKAAGQDAKKADDFILPGVPIKEAISEKQVGDAVVAALGDDSRTLISRLTATVILDKSVSQDVVKVVKEVAGGLLAIDAARGDQLVVRQMYFQKNPFYWGSLLYPPNIYWVIIVFAVVIFTFSLPLFLFGPFKGFATQFTGGVLAVAASLKENGKAEENFFTAAPGAGAPAAAGEEKKTPDGKDLPFSFITEDNLNALLFLLRNDPPQTVAAVVNYTTPELASKILAALPPEKQKEVGLLLSRRQELDAAQMDLFEAHLKKRIGYLVGGPEKLQRILDGAGDQTRNEILVSLRQSDPGLAEQIQRSLITLDILSAVDVPSLQTIIRAIGLPVFSQMLRTLGADKREKILGSLPKGAAERLQQEMELARPFSPQRLLTEKRRVLDTIRRLETRGLITRSN